MPTKPKRPCGYLGCPELTDGRFCPKHQQVVNARYNHFERDPESNKRYGRSWKRIRNRHLAAHPLCEECKRNGRLVPAEEVHHILPLSKGGTHHTKNLLSLCKSCHSSVSVKDGDRWGR